MFDIDRWREIFQSIQKNKLRTLLGAFTVAIGIFIFTVLFGMGNGLKNSFAKFFSNDATNVMFIGGGVTSKAYRGFKEGRRIQLKNDDITFLKEKLGSKIDLISPRIYKGSQIKYGKESGSYTNSGVNGGMQYIEKISMIDGRFINDFDIQEKSKVVVIGRLVEQDLFNGKPALGKYLNINGTVFKVVGVFEDPGGDNEERLVYSPASTLQLLYKNTDEIDRIMLSFDKSLGVASAKQMTIDIRKLLKEKHDVARSDNSAIRVRSVFDNYQQNMAIAGVLQLFVLVIGIGTLFAGAIGIGNIMVFVVKERTKELGIRKALGATPKSIVGLILQESIFITALAGYVGLLIAMFVLKGIGNKLEDFFITNPEVDTSTVVSATIILILVGAIAGYFPARRASKIKPIVALSED